MKNHISIGISKGDDMPNLLKNTLLYFFVCGFPRIVAMAWPLFIQWLGGLVADKSQPQNEGMTEPKPPPSGPRGKRQRKNKRKKKKMRRGYGKD
jgi:hypothetical protein